MSFSLYIILSLIVVLGATFQSRNKWKKETETLRDEIQYSGNPGEGFKKLFKNIYQLKYGNNIDFSLLSFIGTTTIYIQKDNKEDILKEFIIFLRNSIEIIEELKYINAEDKRLREKFADEDNQTEIERHLSNLIFNFLGISSKSELKAKFLQLNNIEPTLYIEGKPMYSDLEDLSAPYCWAGYGRYKLTNIFKEFKVNSHIKIYCPYLSENITRESLIIQVEN